jgi:nucleotide-binding universal stress UspA family protein
VSRGVGEVRVKILVGVDGSESSIKAVEHVAALVSGCSHLDVTLYHVLLVPGRLRGYGEARTPEEEARFNDLIDDETEASVEGLRRVAEKNVLEPAADLIRRLAPEVAVDWKFSPLLHRDVGRTIVKEAREGGYDVIAIGRRGHSAVAEIAFGSVTSTVVHHAQGQAVWIID